MKIHLVVEDSDKDRDAYDVLEAYQEHLEGKAKRKAKELSEFRGSSCRVITIVANGK